MNPKEAKNARVFGWLCVGFSILLLAIYIVKSLTIAADRDVSPALVIISIALLVIGGTRLAYAKKASQEK